MVANQPKLHTLANNLRSRRNACSLTQHELAKKSGVSIALVQSIEHERKWPNLSNLIAIARALDVNAVWLLLGDDDSKGDIEEALKVICEALGYNFDDLKHR